MSNEASQLSYQLTAQMLFCFLSKKLGSPYKDENLVHSTLQAVQTLARLLNLSL